MSTTLPAEGYRLTGISPKAYEHPADRAATAALGSIPYLDKVVRRLIELGYERAMRAAYLGSSVRLSEAQLPDLWRQHNIAYATLDMPDVPPLYLTQYPSPNAAAIGASRPIVVLQSELVRLLDTSQQRAVLAHEAAHILSDHQLYRTALQILLRIGSTAIPLPVAPIRAALLEWSRASELTCDRAAALVVRDPLVVCRTLMVITAGAEAEKLDLDAFMRQGQEYAEPSSGLQKLTRLFLDLGVTHALPVKRVHELMAWVHSGEYDRIVAGEYRRREEPVSARAEAGGATDHYATKAKDAIAGAGATLQDSYAEASAALEGAGDKVAEWLRRRGADAGRQDDTD
ncbi:Protease HtpX [Paraconexibacter sp. AEG42_29]|uniref:Protease HtpX n=1 Tax=Paraconexibacter sp. AEG42_29 TaxID=2997339 RepID=A0AAU7API6_9ACTN